MAWEIGHSSVSVLQVLRLQTERKAELLAQSGTRVIEEEEPCPRTKTSIDLKLSLKSRLLSSSHHT
jgi:hypothetical protein